MNKNKSLRFWIYRRNAEGQYMEEPSAAFAYSDQAQKWIEENYPGECKLVEVCPTCGREEKP